MVNVSGVTGKEASETKEVASDDVKGHLQTLSGLHHMLRPVGVTTAAEYNDKLRECITELEARFMDGPKPARKAPAKGKDRMERGPVKNRGEDS